MILFRFLRKFLLTSGTAEVIVYLIAFPNFARVWATRVFLNYIKLYTTR